MLEASLYSQYNANNKGERRMAETVCKVFSRMLCLHVHSRSTNRTRQIAAAAMHNTVPILMQNGAVVMKSPSKMLCLPVHTRSRGLTCDVAAAEANSTNRCKYIATDNTAANNARLQLVFSFRLRYIYFWEKKLHCKL
jgi:hypothetical protein